AQLSASLSLGGRHRRRTGALREWHEHAGIAARADRAGALATWPRSDGKATRLRNRRANRSLARKLNVAAHETASADPATHLARHRAGDCNAGDFPRP